MPNKNLQILFLTIIVFITGCTPTSNSTSEERAILSQERFPNPVELTASDIHWFRDFGVGWIFAENGSPALILPELTLAKHFALYQDNEQPPKALKKFERVFTTFAIYAQLNSGTYPIKTANVVGELPEGLTMQPKFELTQTHIALIQNAWWREGFIDFKYPYGNYRHYEADMALKLGHFVPKNSQTRVYELSVAEQKKYQIWHKELLLALLTFVQHAQIKPGNYRLPVDGWASSFVRLTPPSKQQVSSYLKNAVRLKHKFANGEGDKVIEWMRLNEDFSKVLDDR